MLQSPPALTVDQQERIENIEKLCTCELNSRVRFNTRKECIEVASASTSRRNPEKPCWKSVSGLVERLRECFYPHYDFLRAETLAKKYEKKDTSLAPVVPAAHPALVEESKRLGKRARALGEHIDKEYAAIVNRDLLQGNAAAAASAAAATTSSSKTEPSLYTRILLNVKTNKLGWRTYMAQFIVCAPELSVGTRIDEVCYDDDYHLIVVEHKVGYKQYRHRATAMMNEPLQDVTNCPLHQHFLQCGFGVLMLERYWGVRVHAAFVLYIDDAEVVPVPLPEWFWERRQAIWARFEEQMLRRFR
jgi:hypothetical protein